MIYFVFSNYVYRYLLNSPNDLSIIVGFLWYKNFVHHELLIVAIGSCLKIPLSWNSVLSRRRASGLTRIPNDTINGISIGRTL